MDVRTIKSFPNSNVTLESLLACTSRSNNHADIAIILGHDFDWLDSKRTLIYFTLFTSKQAVKNCLGSLYLNNPPARRVFSSICIQITT